ncbi:MAG: hypothetical protein M0P97_00350 [Candidatus Moranbacteria bacterium]|jgi:hypothetical protein|nr:hypothetical protein [Candidatus Moranbacteria bacterium]
MFPLTHIYCSKRIDSNSTPDLLYGSIFPDIPITGIISWDKMKTETEKFSSYIKEHYPDLKNFAEGLLLHESPNGIDRFVHGENGFAYINGRYILDDIAKYFPKKSIDAAHSFIEFAVEILLVEKSPNLQADIASVLLWSTENLNQLAEAFGKFFNLDNEKAIKTINEFNNFLLKIDLSTRDKAVLFYTDLTNQLRNTNYSEDIIKILLEKSLDTIKNDYEIFLEQSILKCKTDKT